MDGPNIGIGVLEPHRFEDKPFADFFWEGYWFVGRGDYGGDFQKIEDVVYGANLDASGDTLVLDMDVYLPPAEDTLTNRPIALVAHGGFFLVGNN